MCSIVGDFEDGTLVSLESSVKYHSAYKSILTVSLESGRRTLSGGQFNWGGFLLKSNGGVQRLPQRGWLSRVECKCIR